MMRGDEAMTLRERDRMREHATNVFDMRAALRDQIETDRQKDFAADGEIGVREQLVVAKHGTGETVLDRYDGARRIASGNGGKDIVERCAWTNVDRVADQLARGFFAERAALALEGNDRHRYSCATRRQSLTNVIGTNGAFAAVATINLPSRATSKAMT